jgi:hypothetical protein
LRIGVSRSILSLNQPLTLRNRTAKYVMMNAQPQPAPRNVGGRPPGIARRRRELIAVFVQAIGRVSPVQMVEIERTASLLILAEDLRTKALRGEDVAIADLSRLEGTADRAIRRLGIKAGAAAAPMGLDDIVARHAAERADPEEAD